MNYTASSFLLQGLLIILGQLPSVTRTNSLTDGGNVKQFVFGTRSATLLYINVCADI